MTIIVTRKKRARKKPRSLSKRFRLDHRGGHLGYVWQCLRNACIKEYGAICMACNKDLTDDYINIDHIYSKSLYPERAFDFSNLQILCSTCNIKKSNKHNTDYRPVDCKYRPS